VRPSGKEPSEVGKLSCKKRVYRLSSIMNQLESKALIPAQMDGKLMSRVGVDRTVRCGTTSESDRM